MDGVAELVIRGHAGEAVPNRLVRGIAETDHLAILYPGYAYTCDMPLFYYAENLLTERGFDVLRVETGYDRQPDFGDPFSLAARVRVRDDAVAAALAGLAAGRYRRLVLVGKSLGARAMGAVVAHGAGDGLVVEAVWLTPLLTDAALADQIAAWGGRSLFVAGGADDAHDPDALAAALAATGGNAVVVDEADHGLDIPGDPVGSVRALAEVVEAMARFVDDR